MEREQLLTSDGHRLDADVRCDADEPHGGVVVCHPHPQYGGDRFNPVVEALVDAFARAGFVALRFDFRREFAGGVGERLDVVAALDALARHAPEVPLHLAGYSFGAAVALSVDDRRVTSVVAVAPPLTVMQVDAPHVPVLVLAPEHDQICPPDAAAPVVAGWPDATLATIPMADHFMAGRARVAADQAVSWVTASRPPASRST